MSADFDPYYKWLGIAPEEQPPNHYRLLAIRLYEHDSDVIANAADRQMSHIRSFQSGQYSAISQRILNEISAARICLLSEKKKAAYDAQLRKALPTHGDEPTLQAELLDDDAESQSGLADFAAIVGGAAPPPAAANKRAHKSVNGNAAERKTATWPLKAALAGVGVLLCVAVAAVFLASRGNKERTSDASEVQVAAVKDSEKPSAEAARADVGSSVAGAKTPEPSPSPPVIPAPRATTDPVPRADVANGQSVRPAARPTVTFDDGSPSSPPAMRPVGSPMPAAIPETPEKTEERLQKALAAAHEPDEYRTVARDSLRLADRVLTEGKKDAAERVSARSLAAARKADDARLVRLATVLYLQARGEMPRSPLRDEDLGERPAGVPQPAGTQSPTAIRPRHRFPGVNPAAPATIAVAASTRRAALDFLVRVAANVQYSLPSKPGWSTGGPASQLPAEPVQFHGLFLFNQQIQDADLQNLAGVPEVSFLHINAPAVSDAGLATLQGFPNLTTLNLRRTSVAGPGLRALAGLPRLVDLDLGQTRVNDAGLEAVKALPNLTRLGLLADDVSDEGLRRLAALPRLSRLELSGTKITDAGLELLSRFPQLSSLELANTRITDAGLARLQGAAMLWSLNLSDTQVSDAGLRYLSDLPRLRDLNLSGTKITDAGLQHVCVAGMLTLERTQISDAGLEHLKKLPALQCVRLRQTNVTEQGVQSLRAAFPRCRVEK